MRILVIPDKFKGSLTASEVISAIRDGVLGGRPDADINSILASDGGDGFLDAVAENIPCNEIYMDTVDPLGRGLKASYLLNSPGRTAYIEMARTSGLELLSPKERKVMETSTLGTGYQISDAICRGAKAVYIGLGGSATNDGGIGIAHALGYRFLDNNESILPPIGKNLAHIKSLKNNAISAQLAPVSVFAVNDVDNPLYGTNGAAHVYAPQKGAYEKEVRALDMGLRNLDRVVGRDLKKNFAQFPGSGAAGGTAYGLKVFLDAQFIPGIDFILDLTGVREHLKTKKYDFIITGEGKLDRQTLQGKLIKGVTDLGREKSIPVVVVCGECTIPEEDRTALGLHTMLEIRDFSRPLDYSLRNASGLVKKVVQHFVSTL